MLYAVRFHDRPDRADVRRDQMQAHLAWLDAHRDQVLVAGSLRTEPGTHPVGGLWIVEAEDSAAVDALLRNDPFFVHGLRERHEIHFWSKAHERKVLV